MDMPARTIPTGAVATAAAVRPATATRPTGAGAKASTRSVPERSPEYAHLSLEALRAHRQELVTDESRVSYWRRILQGRLDVLRAGEGTGPDVEALRPLLTESRFGAGRRALVA